MIRKICVFVLIGLATQIASAVCFAEPTEEKVERDKAVQQHNVADRSKSLVQDCIAEVIRIHQFFEGWFKGTIERTPENYSQATSALMDRFSQITPDGNHWEREMLLTSLEESHGIYSESDPPFRLWIENARAMPLEGSNACVSIYEEWRQLDGETRGYITTAILQRAPDAPKGVKWFHLQETWLPEYNCCAQ